MHDSLSIAYLCEFPTLLGGERSLLQFLARRNEIAVEPTVVAPPEGPLADALRQAGIRHLPWRGSAPLEKLAWQLAQLGIRIVHANSLMQGDRAVSLADVLGVPAVTHARDHMTLSAARAKRLNRSAAVIAVSEATRAWLVGQGVTRAQVEVVPNAVDPDTLRVESRMPGPADAGDFRAERGVAVETPLVGCIGQWSLRKGQDLFLKAARLVVDRVPRARFVLAGERYSQKEESVRFEDDLRARARRPPLEGRVDCLGYRHDVPRVLAALDVVVIPSRQEPLSRVALEALALGVPVVATAVGGMAEIVEHARTGLLVPAGDVRALAAAIERLLADRALAARVRERGPDRVSTCFNPQRQALAIRSIYDRILEKGKEAPGAFS